MMPYPAQDVTALLRAWNAGDSSALDLLIPVVYDELRRQAARHLRRQPEGHSLRATALVHEAYLRLAGSPGSVWQSRAHFFAVAGHVMRAVLVDHARARQAAKRGGDGLRVTLDNVAHSDASDGVDILALDAALARLSEVDPKKCRIVELRYFTGLTIEETAEALEVSPATIKREWTAARAWLKRELSD
jgi:RNA polymerase sigma factor, TIGR02999 family